MPFKNTLSRTPKYVSMLKRFRSTLQQLPRITVNKPDSYFHRNGTTSLLATTLGRLIDTAPERFKDELAVNDCQQNIRKTFSDLKEECTRLASGLLALNLKKGDRLAIWGPNRYEWILTQMAAAKAGLILVTINPAYIENELDYCLNKVGIKSMVFPKQNLAHDYYKRISNIAPEVIDSKPGFVDIKKYPNLKSLIVMDDETLPGTFKLNDVMNAAGSNEIKALETIQNNIGIDDDLAIMFTSGTTAKPKAVLMSNFAVINTCDGFAQKFGYYHEKAIVCCQVPLFHIFGALGCGYSAVINGMTGVLPSFSYNIAKTLQAIHQEKCTMIYGTPTMHIDLMRHPDFHTTDISSVKSLIGAGARFTPELLRQLFTTFPKAKIAYGCTETTGMGATAEIIRNVDDLSKLDHTGQVGDNAELKVVDTCNKIVPMGTKGEICSRGYFVMKKYWNDEMKTKEAIKDGWYHTGDLGFMNSEGYLTITGRMKDTIIRGGENIDPKEIEDIIVTHPNVVDAQVIGVQDERLGEDLCVWIKLEKNSKVTEEDVQKFCKGKMARYKIPRHIRFVSKYPLTPTGKVQKYVMVEEMNEILKRTAK